MRNIVINKIMNSIKSKETYSKTKLAEIKYGLETLYITITKTIVIIGLSYFLGTIKELLLILIFYGFLRLFGFGLHAKKSWHCWISSGIIFLGLPYIINIISLSLTIKIIISICSIIFIFIFSPADTEKRPLIHKEKRIKFKILCTLMSIIFTLIMIKINNNLIENAIVASLIVECIMISPLTYKIFRLKYANYRSYIPSKKVVSA